MITIKIETHTHNFVAAAVHGMQLCVTATKGIKCTRAAVILAIHNRRGRRSSALEPTKPVMEMFGMCRKQWKRRHVVELIFDIKSVHTKANWLTQMMRGDVNELLETLPNVGVFSLR